MIGDGDSSVFAEVEHTYIKHNIKVEKVECVNHFIRNLTTKIINISQNRITGKNAPKIPKVEQNKIAANRDKITIGVRKAIEYNSKSDNNPPTSVKTLIEDLDNVLNHVFGDHTKCKPYFCTKTVLPINPMIQVKKSAFFKPLSDAIHRGIMLAPRLIHNRVSNDAENFMSICCKYISGKRVHYGARGGYNMRMTSAMFSFDDCSFWVPQLYRTVYKSSPSTPWTISHQQSARIRDKRRTKKYPKVNLFHSKKEAATDAEDDTEYGAHSRDADAEESLVEDQIQQRYSDLQVDQTAQAEIQKETREQSACDAWFEHRRQRITASNAKLVFKLRDSTSNKSVLNTLLYPSNLDHIPALQYGRQNEKNALKKYEPINKFNLPA
jgi:hypothetical protein